MKLLGVLAVAALSELVGTKAKGQTPESLLLWESSVPDEIRKGFHR